MFPDHEGKRRPREAWGGVWEKPGGGQWLRCGQEGCWDLRLGATGHWTPPFFLLPPVDDLCVCGPTRPKGARLLLRQSWACLDSQGPISVASLKSPPQPCCCREKPRKGRAIWVKATENTEKCNGRLQPFMIPLWFSDQVCVHQPPYMHELRRFQSHQLIDPLICINIHLGHTYQTLAILRRLDTFVDCQIHIQTLHIQCHTCRRALVSWTLPSRTSSGYNALFVRHKMQIL